MKIQFYQADAFTDHLFGGNPAGVCPLRKWLPDETMQNIAMENNLAETAFFVRDGEQFQIRWFTPTVEVDLCGHATLASAYILFEKLNYQGNQIIFTSRSGILKVTRDGDLLTLDFPADMPVPAPLPPGFPEKLGLQPVEVLMGKSDWMLVLGTEKEVEDYLPDFSVIALLEGRGMVITARGKQVDFVSRFFAPQSGIPEDPVTGSAHTMLAPFWGKRMGKDELTAIQLSKRKGHLWCKVVGDRVKISGNVRLYLTGEIEIIYD